MIRAIFTADWHIGATDPNQFYKEVKDTLIKKVEEMVEDGEALDAIFIAGDLFDSKQYFSSQAVKTAIAIFQDLIAALNEENDQYTSIYILQGTRTHDADQLDVLEQILDNITHQYANAQVNCYVIKTMTEIQLADTLQDVSVLCLPEEYLYDPDEYYKEALGKKYDFIVGHGMIDKIWYAKKNKEDYGASQLTAAPVFELHQLMNAANYSFFGHVHTHKDYYNGKFRYLGPLTRWEFGSNEPLGITYVEYDPMKEELVTDEFIINEKAPYLPTRLINLMGEEEVTLEYLDDLIAVIMAEEIAHDAMKIRFIVNLNSSLPNATALRDFLIAKIGDIPIAKLVISQDFDKDVVDNMKESMELEKKSLDYILNRNIDIEDRIRQFIQTHSGKDLSIEKIQEYLEDVDV